MPMAEGDRQTDGRPERVAAAHPVPEFEHVRGIDAEFRDCASLVDSATKCLATAARRRARRPASARADRALVMRLLGGEGLRGDDEQRGLRAKRLERLGDVGAVDVGDEVDGESAWHTAAGLRSTMTGTEVGAADADVDDVGDASDRCGRSSRRCAQPSRRCASARSTRTTLRHDVLAVQHDRSVEGVAQCDVEHRPVLR